MSGDQGTKHDAGKSRVDLLPSESLLAIGDVLAFGAEKYAADNWRKGLRWRRVYGALLRHMFAWERGEELDPESGHPHLAHAGCCILFLLSYSKTGAGTDDRYTPDTDGGDH